MPSPIDTQREKFGRRVRALRTERGWTLQELSERSGLAISTISKAERGIIALTYDRLSLLANGFGVDMVDELALKYYRIAAEQGHRDGAFNLAVMHQNGWGVPLNEEEAVRLYTLAAEQGVAEAMTALGRHFSMDYSDAYDPVQAYKWFSLATLLHDIDANAKREFIASKMTIDQVADGNALVEVWSAENTELLARQ